MKRKTQEKALAEEEKEDVATSKHAGSKTQSDHVRTINNSLELVEIQELLLEETGANSVSADAVSNAKMSGSGT